MDDNTSSNSVLLVTLQTPSSRSTSPMTPSPSRDLRGVRLFRVISRKLGRRSSQEEANSYTGEDDSRSSSTDSCSSTSVRRTPRSSKNKNSQSNHFNNSCSSSGTSDFRSSSPRNLSCSSSETGSDTHDKDCDDDEDDDDEEESRSTSGYRRRHHHSTTAASFRKVFASLSLNTRSHSCSDNNSKNKDTTKRRSKKPTPKRILRPPVTYTYVRGLSGLPTQRVPRSTQRMYNNTQNFCYCGH